MPRIGNVFLHFLTISTQIPASLGVQGPGDKIIASGLISFISSTDILSFLKTCIFAPISPK